MNLQVHIGNLLLHGRSFESEMALCLEGNLGVEIRHHTSNQSTERNENFKDIGAIQTGGEWSLY